MPPKCTTGAVIMNLKQIFSEYGIPSTIRCDGGPQFSSEEFRRFVQAWGVTVKFSSPHYPKSNGYIERSVQTVKSIVKKCLYTGEDVDFALLNLRNTPISKEIPCPAELLYGRKTMNILPVHITLTPQQEAAREKMLERQNTMVRCHDKNARDLPPLTTGQRIRVQDPITHLWHPGTIRGTRDEPRSYTVAADNGAVIRRNRSMIRPSQVHSSPETSGEEVRNTIQDQSEEVPEAPVRPSTTLLDHISHHADDAADPTETIAATPVHNPSSTYHTRYGRPVKPTRPLNL